MTLNEREAFEEAYLSVGGKQRELELEDGEYTNSKSQLGWELWKAAKAQAVPDTHLLVEKSKIETWWQDAEEPENFASRIEDMPSLGHYLTGDEIMEITEHHTIHLPSKTIYGVWVDKDGDRSFCIGTLEECRALVASESGAEG
ncbi:hypothetical protein IC763_05925 [Acinetobacter seifertii]|nr:hypothetical protein IC763_05925 [Acinetobacter seifertii]